MSRIINFTLLVLIVFLTINLSRAAELVDDGIEVSGEDWPWWRGPTRDGIANIGQMPPISWSETKNVVWKVRVPGRGHGSATVVGPRVFLTAAEEEEGRQSVICFDRKTGKRLWNSVVHKGGLETKGNKKASQASSTPACDGKLVFVNFLNDRAIYTTALNLDGRIVWRTKITDYVTHQGYGSSPALYRSMVIVSADNKGGGTIAALDRETGRMLWKRDRPKTPNYASPIILRADNRDQLMFTGCNFVTSLDPLTGKQLWEIDGSTTECVTSIVTDGKHVFTSGGYPKNHISAVFADGSGKIAWENKVRVYVPSMLVHDGYLYAIMDAGVATCWKCDTGEEIWKGRLGGTFSSSPILVGDNIYVTSEEGTTFIFRADPKKFELVAENQLGEEILATPTICGSRIYQRIATRNEGRREEFLYCIGAND